MKRILISIILVLITGYNLYAQLYDKLWLTGYDDVRYINFDNDTCSADLHYIVASLNGHEDTFVSYVSKSNICDYNGEMKILANGNSLGNDAGFFIENGKQFYDSIHADQEPFGSLAYQRCLLLPKKNHEYYYINSSLTDSTFIQAWSSHPDSSYIRFPNRLNIYYSVIDMAENDGLGKVISKKNSLFHDSRINDGLLTAVRHANGRDWWVVFAHIDTARLYTFLFTPNGVEGPLIQNIGLPMGRFGGHGTASFSPDGKMLAYGTPYTAISLLDFDRCTGIYSNHRILRSDSINDAFGVPSPNLFGLAFSANNKYLYMGGGYGFRSVAQYALDSADISASFRLIFQQNDSTDPMDMSISAMALAPDNKIYISNYGGSNRYLHCITEPDVADTFSNFRTNYLQVTDYGGSICPTNMPNYRAKASPVYTLEAGHDTALCIGDSIALGFEPFKYLKESGVLDSSMYVQWSISSPALHLEINNKYHPLCYSNVAGNFKVYLSLHDTISVQTCNDRIDTLNISFIKCDTILPSSFFIPSLWHQSDGVYPIAALPNNSSFEVFNCIGQVIYSSKNYTNNWDTNQVSAAMYIYRLRLLDGKEFKGKVFIF